MKIIQSIMTKNPCYTGGRKLAKVAGLMLHSVGCAQPSAMVFINNWNKPTYKNACVHAFIDGNSGDVYQCLPWDRRGWHCASGSKGSGNNTHIGVEMCEPAGIKYTGGASFKVTGDPATVKACVARTYKSAVELFAKLCKDYGLDPLKDGVVISHKEGCKRGIASNHGDPEHLWSQLGLSYTMDGFRKDVKAAIGGATVSSTPSDAPKKPRTTMTEDKVYAWLIAHGLSPAGAVGMMANLFAESALQPTNLQNTGNSKLGMSDVEYTEAVDNGTYGEVKFTTDGYGYGMAQWTYITRKQGLLNASRKAGKSIGDSETQLNYLMDELNGSFRNVLNVLKTATDVKAASDIVLLQFEKPDDTSAAVKNKRAAYAQAYYDKYAKDTNVPAKPASTPAGSFLVKVACDVLNIRKGPGTSYATTGAIRDRGTYTITETSGNWGKLKSGAGWICLDYVKRL